MWLHLSHFVLKSVPLLAHCEKRLYVGNDAHDAKKRLGLLVCVDVRLGLQHRGTVLAKSTWFIGKRDKREGGGGGGTYVVLLLVDLVRDCVLSGLETGADAGIGVALCNF